MHFIFRYPNGWYEEVTSGHRFLSIAATLNNEIIGVLVAEVKEIRKCNKEACPLLYSPPMLMFKVSSINSTICMFSFSLQDASILGYWYSSDVKVAYILILGVKKQFRRTGIGTTYYFIYISIDD